MKKLIIFITSLTFVFSFSFAKDEFKITAGNCNSATLVFLAKQANNIPQNLVINKEVYRTALSHLINYCAGNKNGILPSPYFFNQLIDVAFRRLDAIDGLTYGLEPDPQGKSRREFLNQAITKLYSPSQQDVNQSLEKLWKEYHKNWDLNQQDNLLSKYYSVCLKIIQLANIFQINYKNLQEDTTPSNLYNKCQDLAQNRIAREGQLVYTLTVQTYYKIAEKQMNKYFKNFVKKWNKLFNQFVIFNGLIDYLQRRFMKVTDANTK